MTSELPNLTNTVYNKPAELVAAEIREATLRGDKLQEEIALIRVDRQIKAADLRKSLTGARAAERSEQLSLSNDHYNRVLTFNDGVDEVSVGGAIGQLNAWERIYPDGADINIYLNSPGGSVTHGMDLFDRLGSMSRRNGGKFNIRMTVRGMAASMGAILLQAADERIIGPQATLMIHEISAGTYGKIGDIKDSVKFFELLCNQVVDIFMERSDGKITREEFEKKWSRQDWYMSSAEAVNLGFADRIG